MTTVESTITEKGQTTIPKKVRDRLGLVPGSRIVFIINEDGTINVQSKKTSAKAVFEKYKGKVSIDEKKVWDFRMGDMI